MHELTIAQNAIEVAEEEARNVGADRVRKIYLSIGKMTGVVRESLEFAFEIARQGTRAEGAELVIEEVPPVARCEECGTEFECADFQFQCPNCGALASRLIRGTELNVVKIEFA